MRRSYSTATPARGADVERCAGQLHFWGWQLIIVCAAVSLPLGMTQSKEYAELEWPIDLLIAVVWVGFFGVNFFMTLVKRRERPPVCRVVVLYCHNRDRGLAACLQ
ncbi:MAG: cbb3-type cytochrome c oxidase subunit I [Planctomycetaceae bacterium]